MSTMFLVLIFFAIIAYALVAGVFLAFSDFVMRSLTLTGGQCGIEAMQVINREVFRWVFMGLFIGLAPLSLLLSVYGGVVVGQGSGTIMMLAGMTYFVGCFGVTVCFNVPMNTALADMNPSSDTTRDYWLHTYIPRWTFWNSVRTLACLVSAMLLLGGLTSLD